VEAGIVVCCLFLGLLKLLGIILLKKAKSFFFVLIKSF